MARKHYSEDEVLKALRKKRDCRVSGKTIAVLKDEVFSPKAMDNIINPIKSFDMGNGTWGKIDFLTKKCGYYVWFTDKF